MALGDFPYPIVDLRLTHIAAGLTEVKKLKSCCLSANTISEGLDPVYCPGATPAERLANLKADKQQTYWKNYDPPTCVCPAEYFPVNGQCAKVTIEAVAPPITNVMLPPAPYYQYSWWGVKVYNTGYAKDGSGNYTLYTFPSTEENPDNFWQNNDGETDEGAMNRTCLWTTLNSFGEGGVGEEIGFSQCIEVTEEKKYLVGFGVDNAVRIVVDSQIVMEQSKIADANRFRYWNVYPVTLTPGAKVLEVIAHNVNGPAGIGVEIYDCTVAQLMATKTQAQLDPYIIFSTKDLFNTETYYGTDGGYAIRPGWSLVSCHDPMYYKKTEYSPCL